jgi:AcrR family transcriptional regulator
MNMNEKSILIIEAASKLFSTKGFFSTSVQDIAESCSVSKASIYQLFSSKEDILFQLLKYYRDQIIQEAGLVDFSETLSPREQLIEKIAIELKGFSKKNSFISMLFHREQNIQNNQINNLIAETETVLMNWHRESLIKSYGAEIESYIWDLTLVLQGMLKEFFTFFESREQSNPDYYKIALFILGNMDAIVESGKHSESVLSKEIIEELSNNAQQSINKPETEKREEIILLLKRTISNSVSQPDQQDLLSALSLLEEEMHKAEPQRFLIKALTAYLGNHVGLSRLKEKTMYLNFLLPRGGKQ